MAFFVDRCTKKGYSDFFVIKPKHGTPVADLIAVSPRIKTELGRLFITSNEAAPVLKKVNETLDKFLSVVIVSYRKGSEGKGFEYYTMQRVLDKQYYLEPHKFTDSIERAAHFGSYGDSETEAEKLGFKVVEPEKLK